MHKARKRFGQNFLHDQGIIKRIIDVIHAKKGESIVEIGPGQGALTKFLLPTLGEMDVVELDRDLVPILSRNCGSMGELRIHNVDALKFDFNSLSNNGQKLRVIGNLPYNISTPLIFHLLESCNFISDMHFMLQKEVVDRMSAQPGTKSYGRLTVMVQYRCKVESLFMVDPSAFDPVPKVDSAIVRLVPHETLPFVAKDEKLFAKVVTTAFSQRRKTLRNNMKGMLSSEQLEEIGISPNLRSETLSLEEFVKMSNFLSDQEA